MNEFKDIIDNIDLNSKSGLEEVTKYISPFLARSFVLDQLKNGEITLDLRGHWRDNKSPHFIERVFINTVVFLDISPKNEKIITKWADQEGFTEELDDYIPLKEASLLLTCYDCGQSIGLETNGKVIRTHTECEYPNGVPAFCLYLNVPSGKIAFANDLRYWYGDNIIDEVDNIDVNTNIGLKLYSKAYEKNGLIICFCGNTCPGIYRLGHNFLAIGNDGYNEETDEETDHPGENVGGIITDLWWWCAVDYDEMVSKMSEHELNLEKRHLTVIDVDPGKYEIVQEYHTLRTDYYSSPLTFATITRIGDI